MRVPRTLIPILAHEIIRGLREKKFIELKKPEEETVRQTEEVVFEELSLEDKINREVRELLKKYDSEIEKGHLDYRRLFDLTKQKLVKERNIIL
jgi:hypothetical protein